MGAFCFGSLGGLLYSYFSSRIILILMVFMCVDYLTGIMRASVFKKNKYGKPGGLESRSGFQGLVKKVVMLAICCVAAMLDFLLGTQFIHYTVAIGFVVNEAVSIVENAGVIGIPIPDKLAEAILVLKDKKK